MGAKVVSFRIIRFPGARVVGKSIKIKEPTSIDDPTAGNLQELMKNDGHYAFLLSLTEKFTQNADTVGWQGDWNPGDSSYTYLAGVLFKPGACVPDGYECRDILPCEMAVAHFQECDGDEGGDLFGDASGNLARVRDENGYAYDSGCGFFEMEYYSEERFAIAKNQGEKHVGLDFYSPCKKAL